MALGRSLKDGEMLLRGDDEGRVTLEAQREGRKVQCTWVVASGLVWLAQWEYGEQE